MAKKALTTNQSTRTKATNAIFNFPLSQTGRNQLEELADIWGVSLAATIRRSIDEAHKSAKAKNDTLPQVDVKQSKIATLEALLAMHGELSVIKTHTTKILAAIPMAEDI